MTNCAPSNSSSVVLVHTQSPLLCLEQHSRDTQAFSQEQLISLQPGDTATLKSHLQISRQVIVWTGLFTMILPATQETDRALPLFPNAPSLPGAQLTPPLILSFIC